MHVYLKQSGELLAAQAPAGKLFTPNGLRSSVDKIGDLHRLRSSLGLNGIVLVSGAGNIIRGDELRADGVADPEDNEPDIAGRLATLQNTIMLNMKFRKSGIPTATFIADTMEYRDASIPSGSFRPYTVDGVLEAFEDKKVVLIAGGTGENNKSTDNAVLEYARRHRDAVPDADVVVLKGTKVDGVYPGDPTKNANLPRYREVSAGYMRRHYESHGVVDRPCLEQICISGITMRVFADGHHDLTSVLIPGANIGTLIVPGETDPVYA